MRKDKMIMLRTCMLETMKENCRRVERMLQGIS